jgi:outer membrane murein-binding lipoprotein Lpp
MNKDKRIERLQKQLDEARNEAKAIRKENGLLKRKLDKTSKKKKRRREQL